MDRITRPILDADSPEENIARVDTWIAETADKLNYIIDQIERMQTDGKRSND